MKLITSICVIIQTFWTPLALIAVLLCFRDILIGLRMQQEWQTAAEDGIICVITCWGVFIWLISQTLTRQSYQLFVGAFDCQYFSCVWVVIDCLCTEWAAWVSGIEWKRRTGKWGIGYLRWKMKKPNQTSQIGSEDPGCAGWITQTVFRKFKKSVCV